MPWAGGRVCDCDIFWSILMHFGSQRNKNNIVLIFFHTLVLQEYLVLKESRVPLKPVLGAKELLHFTSILMNRLNKTESALF